jgi:PAS domain S-box-containing protein
MFIEVFSCIFLLTNRMAEKKDKRAAKNQKLPRKTKSSKSGPLKGSASENTQTKVAEEIIRKSRDEMEKHVLERTKELQIEIAEHKKTEEALKESESKYRIVADNTYDWEYWLSPEGKFIYVSPSCNRITGYSAREFLHDPGLFYRIVHQDDRPQFDDHINEVKEKRAAGEMEFRIIHSDGTVRWIGHVCQPVFDDKGNFVGIRGNNRDITRRKQAEEESRHFASFPQLNPNPVLEVDSSGKIIFYNEAAINTLKRLEPDVQDVSVFLPGDIVEILKALKQKNKSEFRRLINTKIDIRRSRLSCSELNAMRIYP